MIAGVSVAAFWSDTGARASSVAPARRRIAVIDMRSADESLRFREAIKKTLRDQLGREADAFEWLEIHAPHGEFLAARIRQLLESSPAVVIAVSARAASVVRKLSPTVPMAFSTQEDPVSARLARSLSAPAMHATGLWNDLDLHCKRLELLRRAFPRVKRVSVLLDAQNPKLQIVRAAYGMCHMGSVDVRLVELTGGDGLRRMASRITTRDAALVIPHSDLCSQWPDVLVEEVNKLGLPAVFDGRWLVERGALMSLEPVELDEAQTLAEMTAKILKGADPGTIPIERPRTTRTTVNLATARRQALSLPNWLLTTADGVLR